MKIWNTITQGNTVLKMIICHYYLHKPTKLLILNTNNRSSCVEGQGVTLEMGSGREAPTLFWHNNGIFSGS
jgi:hypothetical protein